MDSLAFGESVLNNAVDYSESRMREPELPVSIQMLNNIPAASAAAGHFARRGSNAILSGGYRGSNLPGGDIKRAWKNNNIFNPHNWNRMENIDPLVGRGKYQPFVMARMGNAMGRWATGSSRAFAASGQKFSQTSMGKSVANFSGGQPLFTGGMLSRITASSKVGLMSDARFARMNTGSVSSFLSATGMSDEAVRAATSSRGAMQRSILTSGTTGISAYAGGYISAFTHGGATSTAGIASGSKAMRGWNVARGFADDVGIRGSTSLTARNIGRATMGTTKAAIAGGKYATAGISLMKGGALMGGRLAAMASPLAPLMTAWMVYDLAKLGTLAAGNLIQTGLEAPKAFQGNLNGRLMDPGFRETESSMTSRARGVQAIQNSRLNARSVLGSEAGSMASHFG